MVFCEELNHIVFNSSDPEKHDPAPVRFLTLRKSVLVLEKRQLVTMVTSVPQDLIGASNKRMKDFETIQACKEQSNNHSVCVENWWAAEVLHLIFFFLLLPMQYFVSVSYSGHLWRWYSYFVKSDWFAFLIQTPKREHFNHKKILILTFLLCESYLKRWIILIFTLYVWSTLKLCLMLLQRLDFQFIWGCLRPQYSCVYDKKDVQPKKTLHCHSQVAFSLRFHYKFSCHSFLSPINIRLECWICAYLFSDRTSLTISGSMRTVQLYFLFKYWYPYAAGQNKAFSMRGEAIN